MRFRRNHGEDIDTFIARWDLTRYKAPNAGAIQLAFVGPGWMLLHIAGVPREK